MERVERHPVRTAHENLLAVDHEAELAALVGQMNVGNVELHDPQADTLDVRVEHFAVGTDQLALGLVESRLAIAARPPQVGLLEIRHDAARPAMPPCRCASA